MLLQKSAPSQMFDKVLNRPPSTMFASKLEHKQNCVT